MPKLKQLPNGYDLSAYEWKGGFVTEPILVPKEKQSRLEMIAKRAPAGTTHFRGYCTVAGGYEVQYYRRLTKKEAERRTLAEHAAKAKTLTDSWKKARQLDEKKLYQRITI